MASVLPNFEYDIFISYRQKDNKGDHWVTEFVDSLTAELDATFKENISIYVDVNPHDGLLDTHDVHKSLEGKLKCLVFIPIISQTYCDVNSFAWQHELCAFRDLVANHQSGLDVVVNYGNVASRILPVKIHAVDAEDKALLEKELGGPVRGIEFIYKEAGVNRPLRPADNKNDNQNKTDYRNQINKTANAIKEIITALKRPGAGAAVKPTTPAQKKRHRKILVSSISVLLLVAVAAGYFFYSRFSPPPNDEPMFSNSVAVLPFVNMSNDPEQEYFTDGITEQIITNLSHISSLKVIARTSVMKFRKTNKSIAEIGKELNVKHVLEGSIRKSGDRIRVTAQLISVDGEAHLWAQDYDRALTDIFDIQDEISEAIAKSLERKLNPREIEGFRSGRSANVQAYDHFLKGYYIHMEFYYVKELKEDFLRSEIEFKKAIHLDTNYAVAYAGLADLYDTRTRSGVTRGERSAFETKRDNYSKKALELNPDNPYVLITRSYAFDKENNTEDNWDSIFKYCKKAIDRAPNSALGCHVLSTSYRDIGLFNQAIEWMQRAIALDPTDATNFSLLSESYRIIGDFQKSKTALRTAMLVEPDGITNLVEWVWLCLATKNLAEAEKTIKRINKLNPERDTDYFEAYLSALKGEKEKALSKYRQSFLIYLALGMKKEGLDAIEANPSRNYLFLKHFPALNVLRGDPRFEEILEKERVIYEERLKKYAD